MKNTIKMSLVAAVAVAGLTTSASAGNLEEMIKGVSMKGKLEVGYNWVEQKTDFDAAGVDSTKDTGNEFEYDFDATLTAPVNDNVTATLGFQADHVNAINDGMLGYEQNAPFATESTDASKKDDFNMTKLYFTYANGPVTAMAGKMGMAGAPWFDDERADGVVAMYNAGPVVVAAANFNNSNALGGFLADEDISAAAVIAPNIAGLGINASLWYADISHVATSYSVALDGKIADMIGIDVRYTSADYTDEVVGSGNDDASLFKAIVSADLGVVSLFAGYGETDKEQAGAGVDLTVDDDAATNFGGNHLTIDNLADAEAWILGVSTTMGATTLGAHYIDGDAYEGDVDYNEFDLTASYAMSKNFTVAAEYTMSEVEIDNASDTDTDSLELSLQYRF